MKKSSNLSGLIDAALLAELGSEPKDVIGAQPQLTANRFDVAFKLLLADNFSEERLAVFNTEAYLAHVKAFGLGEFKEPGNLEKSNKEAFLADFRSIYSSLCADGFDDKKSVVPIANDGSILNGAHRVAAAMSLGCDVAVSRVDIEPACYDYKYFARRDVDTVYMDAAALKYAEYSNNTFLAIVWPSAKGLGVKIEKTLGSVVYQKDVHLTDKGAHNLIAECYMGEPWLGERSGGYAGVKGKYVECFKGGTDIRCYLFECASLDKVLEAKERVRELFGLGKHSIHITDTKDETLSLSRLIFNGAGLDFLNYAITTQFANTDNKINKIKGCIKRGGHSADEYIFDTGIVLEVFGLREASDIDYLTQIGGVLEAPGMDRHESSIYDLSEVFNFSLASFYFRGLRFISLKKLKDFKTIRGEFKDKSDVASIGLLLANDGRVNISLLIRKKISFWLYRLFFKTRNGFISLLKGLGLFNFVRSIYRKLK